MNLFLVEDSQNWILKILGDDIVAGMTSLGCNCRRGTYEDYNNEDVCIHMWWRTALPYKNAKVNVVFITHTDDIIKERELTKMKDNFDAYLCMSPEDKQFLVELGYDTNKVFGINLPTRNKYVRPLSIGIFSRCYPDKRKNEDWLLEFCKSNKNSKLCVFVFIGDGWGEFVNKLNLLGCSFEWINIHRSMPYEYIFQQLKLAELDYYIYMGMDGGAMGSYDAYAMGTSLCISDDGYHKSIPSKDFFFNTREEFSEKMNKIVHDQFQKIRFFEENSIDNYTKKIYEIVNGLYNGNNKFGQKVENILPYSVLNKRRDNYFMITLSRVIAVVIYPYYKWIDKKRYKKKNKLC